ncbi:acyl-CoA dehydrogenase [Betaproteobacteria bacterium]|nr:acyl-CoA dehydrogenase [Betaproteobacteria bacterium]
MNTTAISNFILNKIRMSLPTMSDTERTALDAGTVWWDKELLSGNPNWDVLLSTPRPNLNKKEQDFIDNEVNTLCSMANEWVTNHEEKAYPKLAWDFARKNRFLGMIIPEKFGGLEFSAYAQSEILAKISSRSSVLSAMIMVPNSLGPGELLIHYGTDEQRKQYLPGLASGKEIPAFALTSPWAGSDASSIPDIGIICRGEWKGEECIGLKVTWDKRYITLAPICTVLGLAFRAFDPDNLLGPKIDLGITCALIPAKHPGVSIGDRHMPLTVQWPNGPTRGKDVFIPLSFVIGEKNGLGNGWRMLMECLSAGRAISLPSSNAGIAQLAVKTVGAYSRIRTQFNTSISNFEGVAEKLGKIAIEGYAIDSTRKLAASAIDLGEKPSVISAIAKVHSTEKAREIVTMGMDVIGGKGICHGPSNFLAEAHIQTPISITVEGANILTKSLIIFGQGSIRCHPYLYEIIKAAENPDQEEGLETFDLLFKKQSINLIKNLSFNLLSGLSGYVSFENKSMVGDECLSLYKGVNRYSRILSTVADVCLFSMAGNLKRKELISGRLGDILSNLFIASACLKQYHDGEKSADDIRLTKAACETCFYKIEKSFASIFTNLSNPFIRYGLRLVTFPLGFHKKPPKDTDVIAIAGLITAKTNLRENLTSSVFVPEKVLKSKTRYEPVFCIEKALDAVISCEPIDKKIKQAEKKGRFINNPNANVRDIAEEAFKLGIISDEELALVKKRDELRNVVIHVDEFDNSLSKIKKPNQKSTRKNS